MIQRVHVAVVAAAVGCVTTLLLVFILRWCYHRKRRNFVEPSSLTRMTTLHQAHHNHHQNNNTIHHPFDQASKTRSNNYFVLRRGISETPLFSWADHPSLAADAVENGWSRFAFTAYKTHISSSPSKRSALLGVCASGDHNNHNNSIHGVRESESEIISWEVCQGSADFMQKIRLNPGLIKRPIHPNNTNVASLIRTALPLPGPPLGNFSFPQEAYFEITVLYSRGDHDYESVSKSREGEKTKLIQDGLIAKAKSEALIHHVTSSHHKINNIQDMKLDARTGESVAFSLGLTAAASVPLRVPGSYPGSIGFNSNGSVFLDGNFTYFSFTPF